MRTAAAMVAFTLAAASPAQSAAAQRPTPATTPATTPGCVVGAQLEGLRGKTWYDVTVKKGPAKDGRCFVAFDDDDAGYPDGYVSAVRPRGGGTATRPANAPPPAAPTAPTAPTAPVAPAKPAKPEKAANPPAPTPLADRPTPSAVTEGAVRDGSYSCSKIVGGGGEYRNFGTFTIRGGRLANSPLPTGWSVVSITNGPRNPRGVPLVIIRYQTASGNTDVLDCEPA